MRIFVSKSKIKNYFLIIPFLQPEYFDQLPLIAHAYEGWKVLAVTYVLLAIFIKKEIAYVEKFFVCVAGIFVYQTVITFANSGNVRGSIVCMINIVGTGLVSYYLLNNNSYDFVCVLEKILFLLIFLNIVTVFTFPKGMYRMITTEGAWYSDQCWLLGFKNHILIFLFPCLLVNKIKCIVKNRVSAYDICLNILIIFTTIRVNCSTGIVGLVMWYFWVFLFFHIKGGDWIRTEYIVIPSVILAPLLVVFRIQTLFGVVIEKILGKNMTLSTRTLVWDAYLSILKSLKSLFGFGQEYMSVRFLKTKIVAGVNCHNGYLELLYRGGVVVIILFFIALYLMGRSLNILRNEEKYIYFACLAAISSLLLMAEAELIFFSSPLWFVFFIAAFIKKCNVRSGNIDI